MRPCAHVRWGFLALIIAASASAYAHDFQVGVLYWSMSIPGQVAMRTGLEAEADRMNKESSISGGNRFILTTFVAGDGEAGIERQIQQMRALIAAKVDCIIVQPTDNAALVKPLQEANAAGIPVVAYDQYISGGKLAAYRTSDNYQAGYLGGEYIASRFPPGKELRLIMVEYPHVSSTIERVDGFLDALSDLHQPYRILKKYEAVEPVSGATVAKEILRDFACDGTIDAIFTVNDGGGLAVVEGLAAAGCRDILIATVDGDPYSVLNVKAGRLTVIDSAQFCGPLGAEAMKAAAGILTGQKTPFHAMVPVFPVTLETLPLYPGWAGPIPRSMKKPWASLHPLWDGELKVVHQ